MSSFHLPIGVRNFRKLTVIDPFFQPEPQLFRLFNDARINALAVDPEIAELKMLGMTVGTGLHPQRSLPNPSSRQDFNHSIGLVFLEKQLLGLPRTCMTCMTIITLP